MKIFSEISLHDYLEQMQSTVIQSIENESEQAINATNEQDYLRQKIQSAQIEPITLQADNMKVTLSEQMIPAEQFPSLFTVEAGKSYKKEVIKFHIPYTGHSKLFTCYPEKSIDWTMDIDLKEDEFCFEIINFTNNTNAMNNDKESYLKNITQQFGNMTKQINQYNSNIGEHIQQALEAKKSK